jgi:ABC-type Na+ efflux pump permease subunit
MAKFNATSVYAFVAWIASMVVFVVFILWAFSPRSFFHEIGITYYPSRYYAIALPAYIIVVLFIIIMSYIGINLMMTLEPDDMFTIKDSQTRSSPNTFMKCSTLGGMKRGFCRHEFCTTNTIFLTIYDPSFTRRNP